MTKGVERIQYANWNALKANLVPELFGEEPIQLRRFIFRGQANADWQLRSSFDRRFGALQYEDLSKLAGRLLENFVEGCQSRQLAELAGLPEVKVWAYAQHHGLPTRLLDWSESPYIAAFFAFVEIFTGAVRSDWTAIWCLDTTSDAWGQADGVEIIEQRPRQESRLRSQVGAFSLSNSKFDTVEGYLEVSKFSILPLRQLILPSKEARFVLDDLELMGINFFSLFPDVEGAVREAMLRTALDLQGTSAG